MSRLIELLLEEISKRTGAELSLTKVYYITVSNIPVESREELDRELSLLKTYMKEKFDICVELT